MAGHNKWSKIKHKKGAADAKKSKMWTKVIREITVAAKLGGIDPASNPRLRKALEDGKAVNLPKEPINKALSKATAKTDDANYEDLTYEGYGPGGVAILVDCLTDNRNRTYSEVRVAFNKNGGNIGTPGSVAFGFKKKGQILLDKSENPNLTEDQLMEWGLESGLEDLSEESEGFVISSASEDLLALKEALLDKQVKITSADIEMLPDTPIELSKSDSETLGNLIETLEDLDDVQKVWTSEA